MSRRRHDGFRVELDAFDGVAAVPDGHNHAILGLRGYLMDAIFNQDYPVVQGVVLLVSTAVAVTNLVVDLSYGWLDPRIRFR